MTLIHIAILIGVFAMLTGLVASSAACTVAGLATLLVAVWESRA